MKARVVRITVASDFDKIERWAVMYKKHMWSRWVFVDFKRGEADLMEEIQSLEAIGGMKIDIKMVNTTSKVLNFSILEKGLEPEDQNYVIYIKDINTPIDSGFFYGLRDEDLEIRGLYRTREQAVMNGIVRIRPFDLGESSDIRGFILQRIEFFNPDTDRWEVRRGGDGSKYYWTKDQALRNIYWK